MNIKRSVLTRHSQSPVTIGGKKVAKHALTRKTRGNIAITGEATYRIRREYATRGRGVLIP